MACSCRCSASPSLPVVSLILTLLPTSVIGSATTDTIIPLRVERPLFYRSHARLTYKMFFSFFNIPGGGFSHQTKNKGVRGRLLLISHYDKNTDGENEYIDHLALQCSARKLWILADTGNTQHID